MSVKKPVVHGMEPSEIYEYVGNLGLGIGIDATNPKPWEQKREYRVCHLKEIKDIAILDEGGSWQSYYSKIESQQEKQAQLASSIAVPNLPISIGGAAELSRKKTEFSEVYGRKFVDCKISLCPDHFRLSGLGDPDDFEARLSSWIVDRIRYHASVAKSVCLNLGRNGVDDILPRADDRALTNYIAQIGLDFPDLRLAIAAARQTMVEGDQVQNVAAFNRQQIIATEWMLLVDLCAEFVRYFNITHFVSAIELGAAEYQVKQQTTEVDDKSASANFAVFQSIKATANASSTWKKFSESTNTKKLGLMRKDGEEVERLSVLGVNVLPITDRVRTAYLRQALQRALDRYINDYYQDIDHQFKKGPFKIMIKLDHPPNYYLHVHWDDDTEASSFKIPADLREESKLTHSRRPMSRQKSREAVAGPILHRSLQVTNNEAQAACFFLIPVDEKEEDEYYIVYYHGDLPIEGGRYVPPSPSESVPYYLQADSNLVGWWKYENSLRFVANPDRHCKFRFIRSVSHNKSCSSSLLKDAQDESFYIRCPRHWTRTGYLHVHTSEEPVIGCYDQKVPNNEESLVFLFNLCLVRPPPPQDQI